MAYTALTLLDCKQSLADRHDNGVVPTNSTVLARYVRLINRGIAYCADQLRLTKTVALVVTSGVSSFADDFNIIQSVFDADGNEYLKVDPEDQSVQSGLVYWITGNQTDGFTLNTPTDGTYTVSYIFRPAPLVDNTDVCVIPDIEAPVAYAYAMLRKGESDPFEDSDKSLQECDARIREMASALSINADAIGFSLY